MSDAVPLPIFDGHNDTLLRLVRGGLKPAAFLHGGERGHVDLPRASRGGFVGGLFACFVPSQGPDSVLPDQRGGYEVETPTTPSLPHAQRMVLAMAAMLRRIERASAGEVAVCCSASDIRVAMSAQRLAAVLHIEGAEAIDPDLDALEVLYAGGLRSLGLVWSRPNAFGHGVPFRFPSSPDTGPGLTEPGRALVRACNALGIVVDLAHLNEKGFWDVAAITTAPLVVSHSNAHALCATSRNLTDRQLAAVRESEGLVGLNLAVGFLRADGANNADTSLDTVADMIDYLVEKVGVDHVGMGSDFDGCTVPRAIGDVAGLPRIIDTLRGRGWDEGALVRFAHGNWLRVLERTWGG